ncbi:MAG: hypothetical protein H6811_11570 [Phycisphaeraceae bacterium]|nr:hypothetical protein [Phycisphaeraceae bacterium]
MEWYVPILIFFARICDVPIGTVRMILVISGHRWLAAFLGFFEVIIWSLAVAGVMHFLTTADGMGERVIALVSYGLGFSCGTLLGMTVEERIALGHRMIRVINPDQTIDVSSVMREHGYRVTRVEGRGQRGPVEVDFLAVKRRAMPEVMALIEKTAPQAFVTIERCDRAASITVPDGSARIARRALGKFGGIRK